MNSAASNSLLDWRERVRSQALELGFSLVGFTTAEPLGPEIERRWSRWLATDRAGKMNYLRRQHPRRTHPRDLLPEAQSIIVAAAAYYDVDHDDLMDPDARSSSGKIARYAWGEDYHHVLRGRLDTLALSIDSDAKEFGYGLPVTWRAVADSAPLDERAVAIRAGLGFIGKNSLLIHPKRGSWMLLSELLISIPFPPDTPAGDRVNSAASSCGSCRKCLDACPTQAFVSPYELDPRSCISYLTIEQPDAIPDEIVPKMQGWAFGCDICQEVCPFNSDPPLQIIPEFRADRGAGAFVTEEMAKGSPSSKAFQRRWSKTPLTRPGRKGIVRNWLASRSSQQPDGEKAKGSAPQ